MNNIEWDDLSYDTKDNLLEKYLANIYYSFWNIIEETLNINFDISKYKNYYETIKCNFINDINDSDIKVDSINNIIEIDVNKFYRLIKTLDMLIENIKKKH